MRKRCRNCSSYKVGPTNNDIEYVCYDCGRVHSCIFANEVTAEFTKKPRTYSRKFYFNERVKRLCTTEPAIPTDIWALIELESQNLAKYGESKTFNRRTVSRILKSVKLPEFIVKRYTSKKFKKTPLTQKRFYDKYYEKWKTICVHLTGRSAHLPSRGYTNILKVLFNATQIPFDLMRHEQRCDGRIDCESYFDCWHNFINYDYIFRKLMQIAEHKIPLFKGNYEKFKNEFPLVSKKVRRDKLWPMFKKICLYLNWPIIKDDDEI